MDYWLYVNGSIIALAQEHLSICFWRVQLGCRGKLQQLYMELCQVGMVRGGRAKWTIRYMFMAIKHFWTCNIHFQTNDSNYAKCGMPTEAQEQWNRIKYSQGTAYSFIHLRAQNFTIYDFPFFVSLLTKRSGCRGFCSLGAVVTRLTISRHLSLSAGLNKK